MKLEHFAGITFDNKNDRPKRRRKKPRLVQKTVMKNRCKKEKMRRQKTQMINIESCESWELTEQNCWKCKWDLMGAMTEEEKLNQ